MAQNEQPKPLWQRDDFFDPDGPVCLIIQATMSIAAGLDRFQPAGFPEVGHVIYQSPDRDKDKVCIVDSAASMANHLEQVCLAGENDPSLHSDLAALPYVKCVTDRAATEQGDKFVMARDDPHDRLIATTFTEGHRIASDYFLDGLISSEWVADQVAKPATSDKPSGDEPKKKKKKESEFWRSKRFRETLREEFALIPFKQGQEYYTAVDSWWSIYTTLFKYDPNSLVHGVLFAKEQIKLSRMLTAHLEAYGAARVGSSGVKFDRLGKTTSGQPIFPKDEETAREIRATFIIDLGILRSYGRDAKEGGQQTLGLTRKQKELLLALALWKVRQLLRRTFSYRSGCKLAMSEVKISTDVAGVNDLPTELTKIDISTAINEAGFTTDPRITRVYYPFDELFKPGKEEKKGEADQGDDADGGDESEEA